MKSKRILSTFIIIILSVSVIISAFAFADKEAINVKGKVKSEGKELSGVVVNVIWNKTLLTSVSTSSNGSYLVNLPYQKEYRLEFSKEGFVTQFYDVSTVIPQEDVDYGLYDYESCDVEMIPMFSGLSTSLFETPINKVKWLKDEGMLEKDVAYFEKIKPKFEAVFDQAKLLRKKTYDEKISNAQKFEAEKDYENALTTYNEATNLIPSEKLPKSKIKEVKKAIATTVTEEQAYKNNIEKADEYLNSNKYDVAIKYYQNALLYKPEDIVATEKIVTCEKQKNKEYAQLKSKFDTYVQQADKALENSEFEEALLSFEEAQKILPNELYPKKMIEETKGKTTVQKTYDKVISKADKYFSEKNNEQALKCYKKALELKPGEAYPTQKINEIENPVTEVIPDKNTEDTTDNNETNADTNQQVESKNVSSNQQAENNLANDFDKFVKNGDNLNNQFKFNEAVAEYNKALKIKSDKNVQNKIQTANLQIQKQKNCHRYFSLLESGDKLLSSNKYKEAFDKYSQANKISKYSVNEWPALCGKTFDENYLTSKLNEAKSHLENSENTTTQNIETKVEKDTENETDDTAKINENNNTQEDVATSTNLDEQINGYLKMLENIEKSGDKKQTASIMNSLGDVYLQNKNISQALNYYNKTLKIREDEGDKAGVADIVEDIAVAYYDSGKYESTIDFYEKSLQLRQDIGDKNGVVNVMNELASVHENTFRYEKAIDYYSKSLKLSEELGDTTKTSLFLNNIGEIYYEQKNLDQSLVYYEKSLKLDEERGNEENIATSMNNIGVLQYEKGDLNKAEEYYSRSLEHFDKIDNKMAKSLTLNNLGNINFEWKKLNKALDYYEQSLKIKEELNYVAGVATSLHNIGMVYKEQNNNPKAIEYYNKSNKIANEIDFKDIMSKNYLALSDIYTKEKKFDKAFEAYKKYTAANYVDNESENRSMIVSEMYSLRNSANKENEINQLKSEIKKQKLLAQFEANRNKLESDMKDLEIKQGQELMQKQRMIIYTSTAAFIIILIFAIFLYRMFIQKKKANILLAMRNEEILHQKEEIIAQRDEIEVQRDYVIKQRDKIALQNKEITDSIQYASIIQKAILPPLSYIASIVPDHFIFYKPRDIVSGDFYWGYKKHNKNIIVAADCTGHGVPGAFMSMLGISSLNDIVNKNEIVKPDEILNNLRESIISSLHQTGDDSQSRDGMDLSICVFNEDFSKLETSGAYNSVFIIRNNEIIELKADKMPIGISLKEEPFTSQELELEKGDTIYMLSDGFVDQFGGPKGKKYKARRFKEFLLSIQNKSMEEQKVLLEKEYNNWKGNLSQVDDIIVLGIRVG